MRRPEASDRWRDLVGADGPVSALALDVTDAGSRDRAVEHVLARHGRIDVLVNNAGILHLGSVEDTSARSHSPTPSCRRCGSRGADAS
jgi:NAD(P)-dependent dehydrogenase (short-subunit alcohol dehydrogenase family)